MKTGWIPLTSGVGVWRELESGRLALAVPLNWPHTKCFVCGAEADVTAGEPRLLSGIPGWDAEYAFPFTARCRDCGTEWWWED